jgi:hypothetical protein
VDQKYGAAIRESQGVQKAIPQWYDNFRQQMQIAQQARQAGVQQGIQAYSQLQAGTAAPTAQANQAVQSYGQEAAALGGVADPAAQQRAAQAAQIRGAATGDLGSVLAAQNAAQTSYGASQYANTGQSQLEALQKELGNMQELNLSKGQFATQTDADILGRERKSVLENQAFGLQVANTQTDNALAAKKYKSDKTYRNKQLQAQRGAAAEKSAGPGGTYTASEWKKMTPQARTKAWADYKKQTSTAKPGGADAKVKNEPATSLTPRRIINARQQFIQKYISDPKNGLNLGGIGNDQQRAQVVAALKRTHRGFFATPNDEISIRAALDLAQRGRISTPTLQYLRKQGIYIAADGSYAGTVNH